MRSRTESPVFPNGDGGASIVSRTTHCRALLVQPTEMVSYRFFLPFGRNDNHVAEKVTLSGRKPCCCRLQVRLLVLRRTASRRPATSLSSKEPSLRPKERGTRAPTRSVRRPTTCFPPKQPSFRPKELFTRAPTRTFRRPTTPLSPNEPSFRPKENSSRAPACAFTRKKHSVAPGTSCARMDAMLVSHRARAGHPEAGDSTRARSRSCRHDRAWWC